MRHQTWDGLFKLWVGAGWALGRRWVGPGWALGGQGQSSLNGKQWSAIKSVAFTNFCNTFALLNMNFGSGVAILLFFIFLTQMFCSCVCKYYYCCYYYCIEGIREAHVQESQKQKCF